MSGSDNHVNKNTNEELDDDIDLDLDFGLDKLGMLSCVTHSRKDYIKETDNFVSKLKHLNMNSEKDQFDETKAEKNIVSDHSESSSSERSNTCTVSIFEKENKSLDGLRVLTMNSKFITGFNMGYSFPFNNFIDKSRRKVFKCGNIMRKRKRRSHPYDNINITKIDACLSNNKKDNVIDLDQSAYRLRTTSLSSGTGNRRKITLEKRNSGEDNSGLKRSRSMENLKGMENNSQVICEKTKDIETVSRGMQLMNVQDGT